MSTFGRFDQLPPPVEDLGWHTMPEQQHQRGGGPEGTGDPTGAGPGRGGDPRDYGGGFGEDPRGKPDPRGPGGNRAARDQRAARARIASRQAQLTARMSRAHRNRATRGPIDPATGLTAATQMEREHERETLAQKHEQRGWVAKAMGAVLGLMTGIPGAATAAGTAAKGMHERGKQGFIDEGMRSYDETGKLTSRATPDPGAPGPGDSDMADPIVRQTRPTRPTTPTTPDPTEPQDMTEEDRWWWENFGVRPDPELGAPITPDTGPQPAAMQQQAVRNRAVTPALAYMARVNADIRRARQMEAARA